MSLKRIVSRYTYFFLLAAVFEARTIWEYSLSPNVHLLLVESSIALAFFVSPFPLELLSTWLEGLVERKKIVGSVFVLLLVGLLVADFWKRHSRIWAAINAIVGLLILFAIWNRRSHSNSEQRWQAKWTRTDNLLSDRAAFEKSWQRQFKIVVGISVLLFPLIAVVCWRAYSNSFLVLPILWGLGILELPCLILLFAKQIPMSDEKYVQQLAKAKALHERAAARRAEFTTRRAARAERLAELKGRQKPSRPSAESFSSFVYWSVLICIFGFQDRHRLEKPDLVFLALPAWYLILAIYFSIRERNHPKGPDGPLVAEISTSSFDK
jgi:hypothetical protein